MGQSKPMGIENDQYVEAQKIKAENDFRNTTNQRIQNLEFTIDMINKSIATAVASQESSKKHYEISLTNFMESTLGALKEFRHTVEEVTTVLQKHGEKLTALHNNQIQLIDRHEWNEKISLLKRMMEELHLEDNSVRSECNHLIQRVGVEFDSRIKHLKEEILAKPSGVPDLKRETDEKIQLVELNGQNAVLRSSNNEKQIMLLERKIDNLYQLVKRLEIANEAAK